MSDYDSNPLCYVFESPVHGRGLFARRDIQIGTWIGHYDGPETRDNGMHVLWVEADADAAAEWLGYDGSNELRFLNHSKAANAEFDGRDLYARSLIREGTEITIDYGDEFEADL